MSARKTLKPAEFLILLALSEGERHGYAVKKFVQARTGGRIDLKPATLYRTLQQLLDKGWIDESGRRPAPEHDDQRRRYFRVTRIGKAAAREEARRLAGLVDTARAVQLLQ